MDENTKVIIVGGGGTFGLSTAWYLVRSGYRKIQCLDRWPTPSPSSAGFDRNKIVRTEYSDPIYTRLAHEAIELWRAPLFENIFYETGWIWGTDGSEELGRNRNFYKCFENTKDHGDPSRIVDLPDWQATIAMFPVLASVPEHAETKSSFKAIYNGNAGWVKPMDAMWVIKRECERLGVEFVSGVSGTVDKFLRAEDGQTVTGVVTAEGTNWYADKIILAAGSYCDTLLDFEGQLEAVAYVVTHLRMTEDQYRRYKDLPVIDISRRGYSFPPNEDRIFKIVNTDISYLNTEDSYEWSPISVPRDPAYHPTDSQPTEAYEVTKKFTQYILPEFANAEVESSRLCWDAESHDYNSIIGYHPDSLGTLLIATGGSGHSFKNIVNVGKYVVQALQDTLDQKYKDLWRWRPDRIGKNLESEGRARRPKLELKNATGWKHSWHS
ncbi:FAD-dependent oxidoreductase [Zopfia rhizophila CBS 207.26]|uniref:FAD-dependent oxidoreductase n=1 Tax=Zopfia rhizophila CBS 207.26 TaxID=1314779 RepID=A0A6A6EGK0_9PEZI|nr:FAD-dependent oxidoreductase [Zopfia rhizophila CBS 207.26]